ncbi:MAG: (2Fe-2S)-binding protein [Lachnospiraceae bacterium]|nr:(2Fe-2S)-binding protein [Lachnospiraceae bacterium]HCJ09181.1 (2Fe-2S)-binding protein [Lachnospiraceae bacterium]
MALYLKRERVQTEFIPMADDDVIICRCEEITKGEIRQAIHDGMYTMNEIKRFLRPGMGLCQGLSCSRNIKNILANELHIPFDQVEECTARAPMRPITLEDASRSDR